MPQDPGFFRRAAYRIGAMRFSADDNEHGTLRGNRPHPLLFFPPFSKGDPRLPYAIRWMDPRTHAALNCASRACPPIAVYEPERLHAQLDQAMHAFINTTTRVDSERAVINVSPIFRWYAADFGGRDGILNWVLHNLSDVGARQRVLDAAAGRGASALFLAQRFGCEMVGVEYSPQNVAAANQAAQRAGLAESVQVEQSDVEALPFRGGEFDAVICECAFCTFLDKPRAMQEFARVLRPGGRIGLSDVTRSGSLPDELASLLAWIACIGDARPVEEYIALLQAAGLRVDGVDRQNGVLSEIVDSIRTRLLGAEMMLKLKKVTLPGVDFEQVRQLARAADDAVREGKLGYVIITGVR